MGVDIEELRKFEANVSPGPWSIVQPWAGFSSIQRADGRIVIHIAAPKDRKHVAREMALIVAARNALPALLDELGALREVRNAAEAAIREHDERGYRPDHLGPLRAALEKARDGGEGS